MATLEIAWEWSTRQLTALESKTKNLLYGGAKGGGKSVFLCRWAATQCLNFKGNKGFVGRKRSVDFTKTTLETFKQFVDPRLYHINQQEKRIHFPLTNSFIDYGGLDDPKAVEKFNSAEYGFVALDQAEEIEKDAFSMLRATLRHKLPTGQLPSYQIRLTANPAQCWLKNDFILNPEPNFEFIQALPSDNPFLAQGYIETLRDTFKHRPALLAAYLEGSWDDLAGHDICIQHSWIEHAKKKLHQGNVIKRIIVNDPARFGDDENVIYCMELDSDQVYSVVDHVILEHKSLMDTAGRLSAFRKKHDATDIYIDAIGIGAGVYDALSDLREPVNQIISSAKPTSQTKEHQFYNLRSQMWMEAGRLFSENLVCAPGDNVLCGQLASVKFKFVNGKVLVEPKDDIKQRLGRSPDRADAFVMGLYALQNAKRLDQRELDDVTTDRSGRGELYADHMTPQADYSGYSYAQ